MVKSISLIFLIIILHLYEGLVILRPGTRVRIPASPTFFFQLFVDILIVLVFWCRHWILQSISLIFFATDFAPLWGSCNSSSGYSGSNPQKSNIFLYNSISNFEYSFKLMAILNSIMFLNFCWLVLRPLESALVRRPGTEVRIPAESNFLLFSLIVY